MKAPIYSQKIANVEIFNYRMMKLVGNVRSIFPSWSNTISRNWRYCDSSKLSMESIIAEGYIERNGNIDGVVKIGFMINMDVFQHTIGIYKYSLLWPAWTIAEVHSGKIGVLKNGGY